MQYQQQQQQLQQQPLPNLSNIINLPVTPSPPPIPEEPEIISSDENISTPNKTADQSSAHITNAEPKIPLSHLIATNQYPSLNRNPPANIVQSFAPVCNQANFQTHQQSTNQPSNENEELYSSYVNNPYNLTLQIEQSFNNVPTTSAPILQPSIDASSVLQTTNNTNLNVFRSVNYFGTASDSIPPGSEVLFGNP